ncbi:hypothetical protein [Nocardia sp. CA-135398]|uniref:hypothetical protein n=1 Tax=Nocardia sp. CA-135398 TaxID=3239977 RepID=UPI003D99CAC0
MAALPRNPEWAGEPGTGVGAVPRGNAEPDGGGLCFEAIGYVRRWCDARGVGSGEAIDFGHAFAVLVAAGGSRPNIADAWTNWCRGRDIGAGPEYDAITGPPAVCP